jgi:peroxin-10
MKSLPLLLDIASEVNLAIFYLKGTYYDLAKRVLGVRQVGSVFWRRSKI